MAAQAASFSGRIGLELKAELIWFQQIATKRMQVVRPQLALSLALGRVRISLALKYLMLIDSLKVGSKRLNYEGH